jgi:hypothetical protein
MNILRKALTTLGGVFLAALLIMSLAPKAVRGITATLVQVTNTSANPVSTVSADANFPYEALICAGECLSIPTSLSVPTTTTTGVAVKRLVIEDLNAFCSAGGSGPQVVEFDAVPPADNNGFFEGLREVRYFFLLSFFGAGESFGHATVRIYVDPGGFVGLEPGSTAQCLETVTGHLETK